MSLESLCWPLDRSADALLALASAAGLVRAGENGLSASGRPDVAFDDWLEWNARQAGFAIEGVESPLPELPALISRCAPAMLRLQTDSGPRFVLVLGTGRQRVTVLAPDLSRHRVPVQALRDALCAPLEAPYRRQVAQLMESAAVPGARRESVSAALLRERLAAVTVDGCWILRSSAQVPFLAQLRQAGIVRRLGGMLGVFALLYALEIAGWALVGHAALDGRLDFGWMAAWLLLLLSLVPLRMLAGWLDSGIALETGRLLKQRLLAGALRLDLESVRRDGAGQWLSRVMDSQALESLAVNGGLSVLVSVLELAFAALILVRGAGGMLHLAMLVAWIAVTFALCGRYYTRLKRWTRERLALTQALVEAMVGHRTRLAQEDPQRRAAEDDATLDGYLRTCRAMDAAVRPVGAIVPRGWMFLGLAGLVPAFLDLQAQDLSASLAIGLGGVLFAQRAFLGLAGGTAALSRAAIVWKQVGPLFRAASEPEPLTPYVPDAGLRAQPGARLLDASGLTFRYRATGAPVLCGLDLHLKHGDRILIEGPSGGGKSTLASLLVGLRQPESGLLLLQGLDRHTLGDNWHRLATEAPQFHENHILQGSLAFNLLMGRRWPATAADIDEARELCEELGLGALISRMPAGMQQIVGETGWQLSHGERSRIFLARALLQKAPLTVLDESFAALDPETLQRCLRAAFRHADALVVIAHP